MPDALRRLFQKAQELCKMKAKDAEKTSPVFGKRWHQDRTPSG